MKKQILHIAATVIFLLSITACASRKNNSKLIAEKDSKPVGTTNVPDSARTSNNLSIYPDANPAPIPNPNPNPPSPNPPLR